MPCFDMDDLPISRALSPYPEGPFTVDGMICTLVFSRVTSIAVSKSTPADPAVAERRCPGSRLVVQEHLCCCESPLRALFPVSQGDSLFLSFRSTASGSMPEFITSVPVSHESSRCCCCPNFLNNLSSALCLKMSKLPLVKTLLARVTFSLLD